MHVGIAYLRWRGKRSRHSRRMRTRNFAYLARGPWTKDNGISEAEDYLQIDKTFLPAITYYMYSFIDIVLNSTAINITVSAELLTGMSDQEDSVLRRPIYPSQLLTCKIMLIKKIMNHVGLCLPRVIRDIYKINFSNMATNLWNQLPTDVKESITLDSFKQNQSIRKVEWNNVAKPKA